jgi:dihydroorotate dehydrogenase electron transfer subunit
MLRVCDRTDPLLRRPFSICGTDGETIELLYRIAGKGTAIMASWQERQALNCIGPLGRGFAIPDGMERALLVAGGIGIAPLLFLLQQFDQRQAAGSTVFLGGRTADAVSMIEDFKPLRAGLVIATEDGSAGFRGLVTDCFTEHIKRLPQQALQHAALFSCGPQAMARAVAEAASRLGIACQLSLEVMMACGIGACLGCAVKTRAAAADASAGARSSRYVRVCAEGPVFDASELVWEEN